MNSISHDPLLLPAAAGSAAALPLSRYTGGRAFIDAALAGALRTLAGARLAAATAVTIRTVDIPTAFDSGHEGHEAQRRPEKETVHGKSSFAEGN